MGGNPKIGKTGKTLTTNTSVAGYNAHNRLPFHSTQKPLPSHLYGRLQRPQSQAE